MLTGPIIGLGIGLVSGGGKSYFTAGLSDNTVSLTRSDSEELTLTLNLGPDGVDQLTTSIVATNLTTGLTVPVGDQSIQTDGGTTTITPTTNGSATLVLNQRVRVTIISPSQTVTLTIVVTVNIVPVITDQPDNTTIDEGQTTTLSVVATGLSLTYQWYQGTSGDTGTPMAGATSASFETPEAGPTNALYWCRVTNPVGSVNSTAASVGPVTAWVPLYSPSFFLDPEETPGDHLDYIDTFTDVISGNNATQATEANKPRLLREMHGGLSCVRFSVTDLDPVAKMAGTLSGGKTFNTMVIVMRQGFIGGTAMDPFSLVVGGGTERCFCGFPTGVIYTGAFPGDYFGGGNNTWVDEVETDTYPITGLTVIAQRSDSAWTRDAQSFRIADGGTAVGGGMWNGDIFAVIGWPQKLSDVELAAALADIADHYDIATTYEDYTSVEQDTNPSGDTYRIWSPANRSRPTVAAIYCHGAGEIYNGPIDGIKAYTFAPGLAAEGILFAGFTAHGGDYGGADSWSDLQWLKAYLASDYGVTDFIIWGQSLGGPLSLRGAGNLSNVVCGVFTYPVCDNNEFGSIGFIPVDETMSKFDGLPMRFWHSPDDTVVPKSTNSDPMVAALTGHATPLTLTVTSGEHGDYSNFNTREFTEFIVSHLP